LTFDDTIAKVCPDNSEMRINRVNWDECIVQCLKDAEISLVINVPDASLDPAIRLMQNDPYFHVVPATREEEAIGIAVGAYAVGRNSAVFMQSSGFGNCINAIASLCIPHRVPVPLFINLRGELGEFNIAQLSMGRATRPILDALGIPNYTLTGNQDLSRIVKGAIQLCYSVRLPVSVCLSPLLHGGKNA
jgi:sulfopyruvate decarboxylase subunit alpha